MEEKINDDFTSTKELIKCKAENESPNVDWESIWQNARLKGITNESRTFLWRLLHNLHATQARLNRVTRNTPSPNCTLCDSNETDDVRTHTFSACQQSSQAMNWLSEKIRVMDPTATAENMLLLTINPTSSDNMLSCVWLVAETLSYVWARRRSRKGILIDELKAYIAARCTMLRPDFQSSN